jgi:hypothetical protein
MPSGRRSGPIGSLWYQPAPLFLHGHLVGWPLDIDRVYRDLKRCEGVVGHMYLDTHQPPLVTIGAGNMLPNVSAAQSLPFVNTRTGRPATKDEIAYAFQKVTAMPGAPPASPLPTEPEHRDYRGKARGTGPQAIADRVHSQDQKTIPRVRRFSDARTRGDHRHRLQRGGR